MPVHKELVKLSSLSSRSACTRLFAPSISSHGSIQPAILQRSSQSHPFHTTSRLPARADTSFIDYAHLPPAELLYSSSTPSSSISPTLRLPLLPDTFHASPATSDSHPASALFAPEVGDVPVPRAEVHVVSADPGQVLATPVAVLSGEEGVVVGMGEGIKAVGEGEGEGEGKEGGKGEGLGEGGSEKGGQLEPKSEGFFRDIWKGILEDVEEKKVD